MNAKLVNSANVSLQGTIDSAVLQQKRQKIIQNISKNVKIDGFRKGKVPLSVVENRYGDKIEQDSQNEALNEAILDSLKTLNIDPKQIIGNPMVMKFEKKDNGIEIEAKIGIFPQFELGDYQKLIPPVKIESIDDNEVNLRIEELAKQNGELVESSKESLANNDIANIDFEGFLDNEAFEGGKGENFDLEIGSKRFVDGFEEQLIGMKKGEVREISVTFPQNYNAKHLAGKQVQFKVTLHSIKERKPSKIDDDFAKKMLPNDKDSNVEHLKTITKTQLENEAKNKAINDLKPTLIENLIGGIEFDLPENIIEQEIDIIFRNKISQMSQDELKELQNDEKKAKEKRESFRDEAKKSVKLTFIIDTFAKKDKIAVSDNEVSQVIYYESLMMGSNPKEVFEVYEKNNMIPALKMTILENKILNNLLESTINDKQ